MSESDVRTSEAERGWASREDRAGPISRHRKPTPSNNSRTSSTPPDETPHVPYDVDPADAAEQSRSVGYDEDDYR